MKKLLSSLLILCVSTSLISAHNYNGSYTGHELDHIAFPVGGIGTGMFCFEGTGAISNMSLRHYPQLFHEPCTFAAICVKGLENGTKVLEANVPDYKKFGRLEGGMGVGGTTWGLPRFDNGIFTPHFPFATLELWDKDLPLKVSITVWNPFIPNDEDESGLPVAGFEYTFTNSSSKPVEAVFSFNTRNFVFTSHEALSCVEEMKNGFVLRQDPTPRNPEWEGRFAIYTDDDSTECDYCWFRGGWFDPLTMAWNKAASGEIVPNGTGDGAPGGSLYVPLSLKPGESKTVKLRMAWYFPTSFHRIGPEPNCPEDYGSCYNPDNFKDLPERYEPYYSRRFKNLEEVTEYWEANYDRLKDASQKFSETFFDSTLPAEVLEAVSANLTILKSTTVMRQHDGKYWVWEGSGDNWGSCHGSCEHVWNYAQAVPHLFPRLERSLRETEYYIDQNTEGHQAFRANLPIRPLRHDFHAASDGQLGGIIKAYREWRISGDNKWIADMFPQIRQSMDYCIRTWDPRHVGALEEPHHNTYDIEFWGPDGMCTSIYTSALNCFVKMAKDLKALKKKEIKFYEELLEKSVRFMETELWNGEYFYQQVRWEGLNAPSPMEVQSFQSTYSPEAQKILLEEGPKYQYGKGCISDGVLGCFLTTFAGLEEPLDHEKVRSHLLSVYKYNLKHDLRDHSNPQRPGYALGNEGGLLLCSWPYGDKPNLPFVYSDEVWTGIEYQVAAHLIAEGCVEEGLDIVRTCRNRYDGTLRNPFNEYECGSWYGRALSSYALLEALTGARYDAVEKTLHINSKVGDNFRSFLSTATGYGTVGLKDGIPFIETVSGNIEVKQFIINGKIYKNQSAKRR